MRDYIDNLIDEDDNNSEGSDDDSASGDGSDDNQKDASNSFIEYDRARSSDDEGNNQVLRVLIVDDTLINIVELREILRSYGA